ncbi:MAG TPA: GNAT family N-acetyltransferase [Polyangiaceae bacterium]|nr:GNAT family N-acetyltransferase [Polyangiaceae bacterium]
MLIRRATHGDGAGIARVHVAAIRETCSSAYSAEEIQAWSSGLGPDSYARGIETRDLFVAEVATEVVGFAQLNPRTGEVDAVYVHPASMGRGVGKALVQRLERAAAERGIELLFLDSSLNAAPFYSACGFRSEGRGTRRLARAQIDLACERMTKIIG